VIVSMMIVLITGTVNCDCEYDDCANYRDGKFAFEVNERTADKIVEFMKK